VEGDRFAAGSAAWLARLGSLRNVVRQEVVRRQLQVALPPPGGRVLDVGAGQGTQAIALARQGFAVDAVEPDAGMREALADTLAREPDEAVVGRVRLFPGGLDDVAALGRSGGYQLVLCHGVLMYLDSPDQAVATLCAQVAPGGALSVVARNGAAIAWRPAVRGDWPGVLSMLEELDSAAQEGRDPRYRNEIGVEARADSVEHVAALAAAEGLLDSEWFGVRVATDGVAVEAPVPADTAELAALLDAEEALGRTDPYRRMGTLFHLVARRR
jgi:S-adenosylmethionine-dependent methyltransferase